MMSNSSIFTLILSSFPFPSLFFPHTPPVGRRGLRMVVCIYVCLPFLPLSLWPSPTFLRITLFVCKELLVSSNLVFRLTPENSGKNFMALVAVCNSQERRPTRRFTTSSFSTEPVWPVEKPSLDTSSLRCRCHSWRVPCLIGRFLYWKYYYLLNRHNVIKP